MNPLCFSQGEDANNLLFLYPVNAMLWWNIHAWLGIPFVAAAKSIDHRLAKFNSSSKFRFIDNLHSLFRSATFWIIWLFMNNILFK